MDSPPGRASIFEIEPYFGNFTKPVFLLLLGSLIIIIFFLAAFRNSKLIPGKLQSIGEMGYLFIRDGISREVIGKDGDRFVPLLFTLFFFVWIGNPWGIIPGAQFPVNSRFAFPVGLAITVWDLHVPGHASPGPDQVLHEHDVPARMPKAIYVILAPIELISNVIVRPVTLSIRLFANMFAGHLLLTVFTVATFLPGQPVAGRDPGLGHVVPDDDHLHCVRGADPGLAGIHLHAVDRGT